jgi:hypothetical protein
MPRGTNPRRQAKKLWTPGKELSEELETGCINFASSFTDSYYMITISGAITCVTRQLPAPALLTATLALAAAAGPAQAFTTAPVYGTGQGLSVGARDTRWQVVAGPAGFSPPDSQPFGYNAYVSGSFGANTIDGVSYEWISITSDGNADSTEPNRNWILSQTFTTTAADDYSFDFQAGADNGLLLFVNGTIDNSNPDLPTITGGTQIGTTEITSFPSLTPLSGLVNLPAGNHTLYAVLNDFGSTTSFLIANNTAYPSSPAAVPGPLPILGAAGAFGWSRRLRRRIHLARPTAPSQDD